MENEIVDKPNFFEKISNIIKKKKKIVVAAAFILLVIFLFVTFLNHRAAQQNEKISEKYIEAGIYLSSENKEKSKILYEEIIHSKNKFYSILALNKIIENKLEKNSDKVLSFFKIVEDINNEKEQINLIKLKKALYLMKNSKEIEGKQLLEEIINESSIWKNTAIEISNK